MTLFCFWYFSPIYNEITKVQKIQWQSNIFGWYTKRPFSTTCDEFVEMWEKHPESEEILRLQEMHRMATHFSEEDDLGESSNEDGEDEDDDENSDGTATTSNNPFALLSDDWNYLT